MSLSVPFHPGLITFTSGQPTVTGDNDTDFTVFDIGDTFVIPGIGQMVIEEKPTDPHAATCYPNWGGTTQADKAYNVIRASGSAAYAAERFGQLIEQFQAPPLEQIADTTPVAYKVWQTDSAGDTVLGDAPPTSFADIPDFPEDLADIVDAVPYDLITGLRQTMGGCALLTLNGSNLELSRSGGKHIVIDGLLRELPASPLTLAAPSDTIVMTIASPAVVTWAGHGLVAGRPVVFSTSGALPTGVTAGQVYWVIATGLTTDEFQFSATPGGSAVNTSGSQSGTHKIGTLRFIYATYTGGAVSAISQSRTAPATSTTSGNEGTEIKTGDNAYSLVGMAFDRSGAWVDSLTQRLVRTWFRRPYAPTRVLAASYSENRSITDTSYARLNVEGLLEFLTWAGEAVSFHVTGGAFHTDGHGMFYNIHVDGTATRGGARKGNSLTGTFPLALSVFSQPSSLGFHTAELYAQCSTAGAGGGVTGSGTTSLATAIRGKLE